MYGETQSTLLKKIRYLHVKEDERQESSEQGAGWRSKQVTKMLDAMGRDRERHVETMKSHDNKLTFSEYESRTVQAVDWLKLIFDHISTQVNL